MTCLDPLESRRLMASTGLDPTFGTNGTVTLANATVGDSVVSFPGGYVVEAQGNDKVDYLYRLTTGGRIETAWGDHGRVALRAFNVETLAYDKKYGLLYAAGVTKRFADTSDDTGGNTATLRVQRLDARTGATDAAFGNGGVASLRYGVNNRTVVHDVTIGRLQPLARRGLAVAFEHTFYDGPLNYYSGSSHQLNDVMVLKYDARGAGDAAFGSSGVAKVLGGYHDYAYANTSDTQRFDDPDFADLQVRVDGSMRVLTSRRRGSSTYTNDDEGAELVNDTLLVGSQVLRADGTVDAMQEHLWRVAKTVPSDYQGIGVSGEYQPQIVRAVGDDGATVVGTRYVYNSTTAGFINTATVSTLSADRPRPVAVALPQLNGRFFERVLPSSRGYYLVTTPYSQVWSTRLKSDFRIDPAYNGGAQLITPLTQISQEFFNVINVDVDGRLIVLIGDRVARISG